MKAAFRSPIRECPCCGKTLNKQHEAHHGSAETDLADEDDDELCMEQISAA